jgi:hypothetical protein
MIKNMNLYLNSKFFKILAISECITILFFSYLIILIIFFFVLNKKFINPFITIPAIDAYIIFEISLFIKKEKLFELLFLNFLEI